MSNLEHEMVALWLQSNQVTREAKRVDNHIKGIILNSGVRKRDRKYSAKRIENFGKYIERNF